MLKFIVDGMLGGLARWLRMLGYETEYDSDLDDNSLLKNSQEKNAILLTRDEELHNRATANGVTSVLVQGETEEVRLAQLVNRLGISLDINMANTKCSTCGSELREISKEEAAGTVPSASLTLYERFWKCTGRDCGKMYWVGSHWKRIHQTLAEARKISSRQ
ncbi:MAG TPA: Mut7-C RNAse domain-containing protein [Candidatus Dormibacteraeota bacterium]|jgi:uncharacterized protein with PIN domain|nr:Mut7-C RNAse domain-containing protein [Candidatus Dormibacteraeota bacterium]